MYKRDAIGKRHVYLRPIRQETDWLLGFWYVCLMFGTCAVVAACLNFAVTFVH